jgi:hypothetical protein
MMVIARISAQSVINMVTQITFNYDEAHKFDVRWLIDDKFIFALGKKGAEPLSGQVTGTFDRNGLQRLIECLRDWTTRHTSSPAGIASPRLYIHLGSFASVALPPEAHLGISAEMCSIVGKQLADYVARVDQGQEKPMPAFVNAKIFPEAN